MGIRGLTTFIQNRSDIYLRNYELHDCNAILDGNSISCQLYQWHCKANDCFGGDYDKYAHVVRNFFDALSQCKITPYVIFDGGYEKRKIKTIVTRMKNKIKTANSLNSTTEGGTSVFPLFLREVFIDILFDMNVKLARCEFEGDTEIASIAKILNCPVLSYDSDFYIFDAAYIPFTTLDINVKTGRLRQSKQTYKYLSCKVYYVENFLNSFGGMDKRNLPLLAALLGNDYVQTSVFSSFFNNLRMEKCSRTNSEQHRRIKSVIVWLKNETLESAIKKVISRFKVKQRRIIAHKIQRAIKGYYFVDSGLAEHLGISSKANWDNINLDADKIAESDETVESEDGLLDYKSDSEDSDEEAAGVMQCDTDESEIITLSSNIFKDRYRQCLYPGSFMDIALNSKYYCNPQVEESSLENSHLQSFDILAAMHRILVSESNAKNLTCIGRISHSSIKNYVVPFPKYDLPSLQDVQNMNQKSRSILLLKILSIEENFFDVLDLFPDTWHLFIISLKYCLRKNIIDSAMLHSLIICHILLNIIDKKVGFYRATRTLEKKYPNKLPSNGKVLGDFKDVSIKSGIEILEINEAVNCLKSLISYFQMDVTMRERYKLFDRFLVHSMSEYQSCLYHIKFLYSLLNFPFINCQASQIFDGTFIYNMTSNLKKRTNIQDYIEIKLKDCPLVVHLVRSISKEYVGDIQNKEVNVKRSRKRKRSRKNEDAGGLSGGNGEGSENSDYELDPNNKFSLLGLQV